MKLLRFEKPLAPASVPAEQPDSVVRIEPFARSQEPLLWISLHQATFSLPRPWSDARFHAEFPSLSEGSTDWLWLAFDQRKDRAMGSVGLSIDRDDPRLGHVRWLMVRPTARRRGIARRLIRQLESAARENKVVCLSAETSSAWTEAIAFYRADGFSEARR